MCFEIHHQTLREEEMLQNHCDSQTVGVKTNIYVTNAYISITKSNYSMVLATTKA